MRGLAKLAKATTVLLLALAAGPLASASAEPPTLAITSPTAGTLSRERSPTIAGSTSDTLDAVTVSVHKGTGTGGALVREESTIPVGETWMLPSASLADGTYTVLAKQTNSGTLEEGMSEEVTFAVDATAPAVTLNVPAAVTNESTVSLGGAAGTEAGDLETVSVTVHGTTTAGQEVTVTATPAVNGGTWSFAPTLADGTYTVQVTQEDKAGNIGSAGPATFRVDTTPPGPLTLNVNPGSAVIASSTPTFEGAAGKEAGDGEVHVLINGKLAAQAPVSGGAWKYTPQLADGSYMVRAEQIDEAGNVSKTSVASFRIDTTAPVLAVTSPQEGEKLSSSLVTFLGSTGDAEGDLEGVTVEVVKDAPSEAGEVPQRFTVSRKGGEWSSKGVGLRLSNGTYTVHAEQLDSVGHLGMSPAITFTVASPAPVVTLKALPRYTADTTPSFAGTAETSSEAKSEVALRIWRGTSASGVLAKSVKTSESGGAWAIGPIEALPEGTYTAQVEQPTEAKNPAGVSGTTTFTVDTTAPALTLNAPSESTGLETVSGAAGIEPGDRRQVTAELFQGATAEAGAAFETITVNDNPTTGGWSAAFAELPGGEYTVLARQSDEAGNVGESPASRFTVTVPVTPPVVPPAAPAPPTAAFTWVPASPTVGQSVSLVSSSTDPSSPLSAFAWDVAGNGQFAPGGPLMTTSFATAGPHLVRLQVVDAGGLAGVAAETINVSAPALTLMQPFPIVRIAGSETASGVRVKLLTVQAPSTTKVAVTCKGHGCKTKSESRIATASSKSKSKAGAILLSFPRFERSLQAGAVLQIRVSKAGQIGKFTSFTIRRHKLPVRVDACLRPPSANPTPCPST